MPCFHMWVHIFNFNTWNLTMKVATTTSLILKQINPVEKCLLLCFLINLFNQIASIQTVQQFIFPPLKSKTIFCLFKNLEDKSLTLFEFFWKAMKKVLKTDWQKATQKQWKCFSAYGLIGCVFWIGNRNESVLKVSPNDLVY